MAKKRQFLENGRNDGGFQLTFHDEKPRPAKRTLWADKLSERYRLHDESGMILEPSSQLEYVVYRQNWKGPDRRMLIRLPGQVRVATFRHAEQATIDGAQRERAMRKKINPFMCGPAFHYLSTMPVGIYYDWLRDHDIEPPSTLDDMAEMASWWRNTELSLTTLQWVRAWEGLDKVQFFTVQAIDPQRIGYAVMAIQWEYNDAWYVINSEGGAVVKIFRARKKAERYRRECEYQQRRQFGLNESLSHLVHHDDSHWPFGGERMSIEEARPNECFYEILEVELA